MDELQEFAMSSNGDRWFLERGAAGQSVVLHKGNPASGGHETRTSVEAFLAKTAASPEREALLAILDVNASPGTLADRDVDKTPSLILAEEYLRLGGRRLAKVDDNIVSTRQWNNEPAEAAAFWKDKIEPMDEKQRREVELHLPSISDV